ncbi:MAG TPA: radical SAM protein [Spirochaetia bacterium]|nr:radical SAM protein [Spirochaetia bacterium]
MSGREPLSVVFLTAAAGPGTRAAPFGAARVASALKAWSASRSSSKPGTGAGSSGANASIRVSIVEAEPDESPEAIAKRALALSPDLVGLSLYSWNSGRLEAAGTALKAARPGLVIVAGGPDASADPEALATRGPADVVVAGEGERAIVDLVGAMLAGDPLPGPVVRAAPVDPAGLSSPWLDGTLDPGRWGGGALELTRGCPYRCAFCFESKGEARLRRFPLETAGKELERFEEAMVEEVFVLDPTFNADPKRMAAAVRLFSERGPNLRYFLEIRAELLTAEQARLLGSLDCSVQIGLQSADPAVLALVDRTLDPDLFARKTRLLDEEGVVYGLDLIYGLPGDTLAGFRRSLDYALGLGPNHLDVFRLAVLPGTALHDRAAGLGLDWDRAAPYLVRSTPTFRAAELEKAERLAVAADVLYTRGRAVMWFRSVAALARAKPSALLAAFADFMDEERSGPFAGIIAEATTDAARHDDIELLQTAFFGDWFERRPTRKPDHALAAIDLIKASGAWTRAFAEGATTTMELGWPPEDLLDYATFDVAAFADETRRSPQRWTCSPGRDGPRFAKAKAKAKPGR